MRNEPVLTAGFIASAISAFVVLLDAFGVPITPEQAQAINGFIAVVAPLGVALVARHFVYPAEAVKRERRQRHGH